jgi:linoleoyl-CoA desaturase
MEKISVMSFEAEIVTRRSDSSAQPAADSGRLKFTDSDGFLQELRGRVDRYFRSTGRRPRDCPKMYLKTAIVMIWFAASYGLLVFGAGAWWTALPLAVSLGLSLAAVGFNIQHDGAHQAYSRRLWVNKLMAMTADLIGASSYLWRWKHNVFHHTYVNVAGHDTDIDVGRFARLSPHAPRLRWHRWQQFYLWPLYGLMAARWHLFGDFHEVIAGKMGPHRIPRPRGWDLAVFLGGKLISLTIAFVIPLCWHPIWEVALFYLIVTGVMGIVLAVVFQLAHCVGEAEYPLPAANTLRMEQAWDVHQVQTTVDFARKSWILCWLLGGLNFQIEHHLFPRICHVHYPALSKIVEEACHEFGVRYVSHRTFLAGVISHFRWLRRLGMATTY